MRLKIDAVSSYWDELEKIAAGPLIIDVDDHSLLRGQAVNVTADSFLRNPSAVHNLIMQHWPETLDAAKKGRGVVLLPTVSNLERMGLSPEDAQASYRQLRRHELTHWMRQRKGYGGMESAPGLRNVLKNVREELAAHMSQASGTRAISDAQRNQLSAAVGPGTLASVQNNYAHLGGARKAALGGNFGRALRALRLVK